MLILLASVSFIFILLISTLLIVFNITSRLSQPSDLKKAKLIGDELLSLKDKTILMVGAHPDDVDWYCGGTLSALHKKGNKIVVVVATSGEKGGKSKNLAKTRELEQKKAAKIMGYDKLVFLRLPDRGLKADSMLINKIELLIEKYRPSVLFTFDSEKEGYIYRHSDHNASGEAALKAAKGFNNLDIYFFHSSRNNVIVDISKFQVKKMKALAEHNSQQNNKFAKFRRLFVLFRFRPRGSAEGFESIGVKYGEIFRKY